MILASALLAAASWGGPAPDPPVATFSIVAVDPATREWGVAVQSRFLAVGSVVPWAKAGVGAVATQSFANTRFGPDGLALLEKGASAEEALAILLRADEGREDRQVGIVDARGAVASFTGPKCLAWAGHAKGTHYACQGNILAGEEVVRAMARAFETSEGELATRLLSALEAGQEAGGDRRGKQSAAILVVREGAGYGGFNDRFVDLRVDDHAEPIAELKRVYRLWARTFGVRARGRLGDEAKKRGDEEGARRDYEAARAHLLEAIRERPEDARARSAFAWFGAERGLWLEEALEHAERAVSLSPENAEILDTLATVHFRLGDAAKAVEIEEKALRLRPGDRFFSEQLEKFRKAAVR